MIGMMGQAATARMPIPSRRCLLASRDGSGDYYGEGYDAGFVEFVRRTIAGGAYLMGLNYNHNDAMLHDYGKYGGFSVRCLRD
jgi:hypothetical protein